MFKCRLVDQRVPAMSRSLAAARLGAELPSGKAPTTRVRLRISRMMRLSGLLVLMRRQCSSGNAWYASVSGVAVATSSAALPSLMLWSRAMTSPALRWGRRKIFLGMDGLERQGDLAQLAAGHVAEDVAVNVNHAALPARVGEELGGTLDQAHAGVGNDQLDAA